MALTGATKTEIVYRSNLNFKLADECLAHLLKTGYVSPRSVRGRHQFITTIKGADFLSEIRRLDGTMRELLMIPDMEAE